MTKIEIFDPALCCVSGVCGTEVDQALVTFAADFDWAKAQDADIRRYNLAQEPLAFAENAVVKGFLERSGADLLPLTLVNGEIALTGRYPRRAELARFAGISTFAAASAPAQSCCGGNTGCC
ncbi:arsenite efflux transporter metallochaperone ArsD [Crenobacter caeni]|uniref:Arsenite efflux transporter metallochaperone ArsD n=1 Tax=Crenobacter caeni TaxID=2705474 RepID=A0A6B2KV16_9NEIS|nr:arsenite efflux transporter metallochaperone ArsD [Crenobacter caeni]NDV14105.1 arsenite efflux transporter metallochaperone ArsD [Crenobacter caeni]